MKRVNTMLYIALSLVNILFGCKESQIADFSPVGDYKRDSVFSSQTPFRDSSILSYYSFDTSIEEWYEKSMYYAYSASISDVARLGRALRIELRKGENIRSELGTDPKKAPQNGWYGFSVLLPAEFLADPSQESIAQFQAKPDFSLGEEWRSPPVSLGVLNDRWVLDIRTSAKKVNTQGDYTFERIDLGAVGRDKWTDFVFHINWQYNEKGVLELWMNNKLVYSRLNMPNCYNDLLSPYFKIGIYKWDWAGTSKSVTTSRVVYIDEVRIGNEKSGYDKVYPGRN